MRPIPYALAIAYLTLPTINAIADATEPRAIALDDPDIVYLADPHLSSMVNEIKSAYSSVASRLPPGLLSHIGAILPIETAPVGQSRASSKTEIDGPLLYGIASIIAGWIMFN
jgi:hypothetical protein